jgi:hypothetical protein
MMGKPQEGQRPVAEISRSVVSFFYEQWTNNAQGRIKH